MNLRKGLRVGVSKSVDGEPRFGVIVSIRKRRGIAPLVTLWMAGSPRYSGHYAGYRHLDAGHLRPFRETADELRREVEASIKAGRRLEEP